MLKAQVCNWSMTVHTNKSTLEEKGKEKQAIKEYLRRYCCKWGFSLEKGETNGTIHWQIMFALWKKTSGSTVRKNWMDETKTIPSGMSPISTGNGRKFTYVCKAGAIDGPWTSEEEASDEAVMPEDIRDMKELYCWQAQVVEWIDHPRWEERKIRVMVDTGGKQGKTKLRRWLQWHRKDTVCYIPPVPCPKDLARMVMSLRKKTLTTYVIDIPRGWDDPKHLRQLFSSIESLKDGGAWDDRYKGRTEMFTPPKILILTNKMPKIHWMSLDRWVFWEIKDKVLYDATADHVPQEPQSPPGGEGIHLTNPLAGALSTRPYFRKNEESK